ncbi:hypothetical protein F5Y17DRAFT_436199 [Xylariaceae sp. FL0594]|nr:hypothetical protein F5Y17DRAFT_436199 [Xylariaceae sp. FL0594]
MYCICRTKSLRIFVQSLTELRVADSAACTSRRFHRPGTQLAFRQSLFPQHTRLFATTAAAYSSEPKCDDSADSTSLDNENAESSHSNAERKPSPNAGSAVAVPAVSENDIAMAKIKGTILDINAESIDALVSELERKPLRGVGAASPAKRDARQSNVETTRSPRSKPPVTHSQLKRLKILKDDGGKRRTEAEEYAATKEDWQIQKAALKEKFPEGWRPRKRLSPDALDGIRALHAQFPEQYTTEVLARNFEVTPEAIRRILKSKWTPSPEEEAERQERWFKRGMNIWTQMAELGKKPPRKWRQEGVVRKPHWNEKRGPRTEWPYMPRRYGEQEKEDEPENKGPEESVQRKLSGSLL